MLETEHHHTCQYYPRKGAETSVPSIDFPQTKYYPRKGAETAHDFLLGYKDSVLSP